MARTRTSNSTFTGVRRPRNTRRSVRVIDKVARLLISLGGIGSIAAVSLVGVFLVVVAAPLFKTPERADSHILPPLSRTDDIQLHADEHGTMFWSWSPDNGFLVNDLAGGDVLDRLDGGLPTNTHVVAFASNSDDTAFGTTDGKLIMGRVDFSLEYLLDAAVPDSLQDLQPGRTVAYDHGILGRTPDDMFQHRRLNVETGDPLELSRHPIALLDYAVLPGGRVITAMDSTGAVFLNSVNRRKNLLTGKVTTKLKGSQFDLDYGANGPPAWLLLNGRGDNLYIVWADGRLQRYDTSRIDDPQLLETTDILPEPGQHITAMTFLVGDTSLAVGDESGRTVVWFLINNPEAVAADKRMFMPAKILTPLSDGAGVSALASSGRSRLLAVGYTDGSAGLFHVTNERRLIDFQGDGAAVTALCLTPRDDGLLITTSGGLAYTAFSAPHPETDLKALLAPIWYEGYEKPTHVWQSTGGSDDFEAKYGLVPLISGTLKATFYSLLFGLPLALMAALTTSEFMHPNIKMRVKPAIELMASLPSVVLGFLAALVFAPWLEHHVPPALSAVFTIPFSLLLGAHLWQLLPIETAIRHQAWKFPGMGLMLIVGGLAAIPAGRFIEAQVFAGDIMTWLDGQIGSGFGGWLMLALPLSVLIVGLTMIRSVEPRLRRVSTGWSRPRFVLVDLLRFLVGSSAVLLLTMAIAGLLAALGLDPRGSVVGTYIQRNALVVGFVMGFAIIPIVYTIAEDALSAVPDHLRAASLGAGASPWQTALRVVVPPAASGLFSAMMVGLGRAVGETMIVLMAAGNTPIMDLNIFNGFRTLSANIAVELPEAVQNSTHFRTLFLAALTLFLMTFIINTLAEIVRMRFRKKALQL
jgi:phosphate transport system permease protein